MTYLDMVNAVLRRLRGDEVSDVNQSTYSKLIGDFINETKREVEDAYRWTNLRRQVEITTSAGVDKYELTEFDPIDTVSITNDRTQIDFVIDKTNDYMLRLIDPFDEMRMKEIGDVTDSQPMYYTFSNNFSNTIPTDRSLYLTFTPTPDDVYSLSVYVWAPQESLTDNEENMVVPSWPVILGATAKAIWERGDDGGSKYSDSVQAYYSALSDSISYESVKEPLRNIWGVE